VSKKRIIMTGAAGLVSFVGMFIFSWLTGGEAVSPAAVKPFVGATGEPSESLTIEPGMISAVGPVSSDMKKTMTEKRLNSLVYEVREKIQEYSGKLQDLEVREQRLRRAHNLIKKDIEELDKLRIELASTVASLKNERDKLLKSRVEISKAEKNNMITMAAAYDKMDSESAGKILTELSKMQKGGVGGSNLDDAVKILHYMTERTKAKLLAGLVTSEPQLAALLCQKLKQIIEKE
jgi:flagellar motility protein MotE (MotC chaperone)